MGNFVPDLRVGIDHPPDFYRSPLVVKSEGTLIISGQARLIAEGTAEEGNEAKAGQDYWFLVPAEEK